MTRNSTFSKRIFTPSSLLKRSGLFLAYLPFLLQGLVRPKTSRALREKVMLAVTAVNDCRYCAWVHTHLALNNGIALQEINELLQHNNMNAACDSEAAAIMFAQHYADTNGNIDPASRLALNQHYIPWQQREILSYIHTIYMGNLSGNTFDALLARGKGMQVENSSLLFELVCAVVTMPVLGIIYCRAKQDKRVQFAND